MKGAKFWINCLTELKTRGLNDNLIAWVYGLKGFPDAITLYCPEGLHPAMRHAYGPQQPAGSCHGGISKAVLVSRLASSKLPRSGISGYDQCSLLPCRRYPPDQPSWRARMSYFPTSLRTTAFPMAVCKMIAIDSIPLLALVRSNVGKVSRLTALLYLVSSLAR